MAHDEVAVEAKGSVDDDFPRCCANHSRQPSGFARVHEKENSIVGIDQFL